MLCMRGGPVPVCLSVTSRSSTKTAEQRVLYVVLLCVRASTVLVVPRLARTMSLAIITLTFRPST